MPGAAGSTAIKVTLTNSTVSGNSTAGGGCRGRRDLRRRRDADQQHGQRQQHSACDAGAAGSAPIRTLTNSMVSGNSTAEAYAAGGGSASMPAYATASSRATPPPAAPTRTSRAAYASNGHNIFGSDVAGNAPGDRENVPRACCSGRLADKAGRPRPSRCATSRRPGARRRGSGRRAGDRPARRGAAGAGGHQPGHRRLRAEPDGRRAQPGSRHRSQRSSSRRRRRCSGTLSTPGDRPGRDPRFLARTARPDRPAPDRRQARGRRQPKIRLHRRRAFTHAGQLRFEATADGDFLVSGNIDRDLDADSPSSSAPAWMS